MNTYVLEPILCNCSHNFDDDYICAVQEAESVPKKHLYEVSNYSVSGLREFASA